MLPTTPSRIDSQDFACPFCALEIHCRETRPARTRRRERHHVAALQRARGRVPRRHARARRLAEHRGVAARIKRAGASAATALSMISKRGADIWRTRASSNSSTITGPPGYRVSGSPGSQACGASRWPDRSISCTRRTGQSACGSEPILRTDIQPGYWPAAPMRVPC